MFFRFCVFLEIQDNILLTRIHENDILVHRSPSKTVGIKLVGIELVGIIFSEKINQLG